MKVTTYHGEVSQYTTWYEFKKELGSRLGYRPLNDEWLKVKPKAPLPWDDAQMRVAISSAKRSNS